MGKKITAVVLSVLLLCGAAAGGWWDGMFGFTPI